MMQFIHSLWSRPVGPSKTVLSTQTVSGSPAFPENAGITTELQPHLTFLLPLFSVDVMLILSSKRTKGEKRFLLLVEALIGIS